MTTTTTTPTVRRDLWSALHVWIDGGRDDMDRVLLEHVAPAAEAAQQDGRLTRWFFIRYSEGGPHLRVRLGDADPGTVAALRSRWAGVPGVRVTAEDYAPEVERYGGPDAFPAAEQLFCRSTELVLAALRGPAAGPVRLATAVELVLATARGMGLDAATTAAWLRSNAYSWRWHLDEAGAASASSLQDAAITAARSRREAVGRRFAELAATTDLGAAPPTLRNRWAHAVHLADAAGGPGRGRARRLGVAASQVHMTLNRLGVAPEEERWLDWMIAACPQAPARPEDYFAAAPAAADRSYLVASRYLLPDMPQQAPEDAAPPEPLFDWSPFAGAGHDLPAGPPPPADLWSALRARRSSRGPWSPLAASDLATVLWQATRPEGGQGAGRRAHPSAGGQFPVRMRLVVGAVDGVEPGLYEADPAARVLVRVGARPGAADLAATSMWFRDRPPFEDRIDTTGVPAVVGMYLDLAPIRARYGQRALRFALLEAGHVAQNLALVAAATGVELCTIGGFYDDAAHDVFLLDGVDRVLAYLIPLGAPATGRPDATCVVQPATPPMRVAP